MKNAIFLTVIACCFTTTAVADEDGPFGLRMGLSRDQLVALIGRHTEPVHGMLQTVTVPKKQPDIESYAVVVSPTHGVCKIMAAGKDLKLDLFGDSLKSAFEEAATALDQKYGNREMYDYLAPSSIWREPADWSMSLAKQERVLAASWEPASTTGIAFVMLEAIAQSSTVGYLRLHYDSPSFARCKAELTLARNELHQE